MYTISERVRDDMLSARACYSAQFLSHLTTEVDQELTPAVNLLQAATLPSGDPMRSLISIRRALDDITRSTTSSKAAKLVAETLSGYVQDAEDQIHRGISDNLRYLSAITEVYSVPNADIIQLNCDCMIRNIQGRCRWDLHTFQEAVGVLKSQLEYLYTLIPYSLRQVIDGKIYRMQLYYEYTTE